MQLLLFGRVYPTRSKATHAMEKVDQKGSEDTHLVRKQHGGYTKMHTYSCKGGCVNVELYFGSKFRHLNFEQVYTCVLSILSRPISAEKGRLCVPHCCV